MKEECRALIKKANESLNAARLLLRERYFDISATRAYYAVFYLTEAALSTLGLAFSSHHAAISAFGGRFIKSGTFDKYVHAALNRLFLLRMEGDYGGLNSVTEREAVNAISDAVSFFAVVVPYLEDFIARQPESDNPSDRSE